jgi:hypothetical protein
MSRGLLRLRVCGFLAFLLMTAPVFAASEAVNCGAEAAVTTIGYGTVLSGSNCVLNPGTDVDLVRFAGVAGQVVRAAISNLAGPGQLIAAVQDPTAC